MTKTCSLIMIVLLALLASSAYADTANPSEYDIGQIIAKYRAASIKFEESIRDAARWIFLTLVIVGGLIIPILFKLIGENLSLMQIGAYVVVNIVSWGFQWHLINSDWLSVGIDGFKALGEQASGLDVVRPFDILWQGIDLMNQVISRFSRGAWITTLFSPFVALILGISALVILAAYLILTVQFIFLLVQTYFYLAVAPLMIALTPFKPTRDIGLRAMSSVIPIGIKILAIYFVIVVAKGMAGVMGDLVAAAKPDDITPFLSVVSIAFLIGFLALKVPTLAADLLNGSASLSAGDALVPGAAAAAGALSGAVAGGVMSAFKEIVSRMPDGPMKSALDSRAALNAATDLAQHSNISPGSTTNGFSSGGGSDATGSSGGAPDLRPSWMTDSNSIGAKDVNDGGQSGSIGGAGPDQSDTSRFGASVAEHVRGGLQEFAQAEKAHGASVNIQAGHDEF